MRISTLTRASATTLTIAAGLLPPNAAASGDDIVLRRDGSKAVPFVQNLNPRETSANAAEGFDWRDAGLGAGAGALLVALGAAGVFSLRSRQVAPMTKKVS